MNLIDYYFLKHAPKEELLTPQEIEDYKKVILDALKISPLLEAEIDMAVRTKLKLPIYPTEEILGELIKEKKIAQMSNGKYYLKKVEKKTLDAWFK